MTSTAAKRILANSSWHVLDGVFRQGLNFVILAWMARALGPDTFGAYNYALAFVTILTIFAGFGLDSVVIREIVRRPNEKGCILGSAFTIRVVIGSVVVLAFLTFIGSVPKARLDLFLFACFLVSIVLRPFEVIDLYFQSQMMARYGVLAKNYGAVVASLIRGALVIQGLPVLYFAIVYSLEVCVVAVFLAWMLSYAGDSLRNWRVSKSEIQVLLVDCWPLLLAGLAVTAYMRLDQIMIGQLLGEKEVGLYSTALRVSEAWYLLPTAFMSSVYPVLMAHPQDSPAFEMKLRLVYEGLTLASLGIAIFFAFFGERLVLVLFGLDYAGAGAVLAVHGWTGILVCMGVASSSYLMAKNFTRISLVRTVLGMIANYGLNLVWIPKFGVVGAAYATLVSQCVAVFSLVWFAQTRRQAFYLLAAFIPFAISRFFVLRLGRGNK